MNIPIPSEEITIRCVAGFNYLEAIFWMLLAFWIWRKSRAFVSAQLANARFASVVTFVFGCSDLVEAQTGAWWRPVWLLIWKASCLVILVLCWRKYSKRNFQKKSSHSEL